MSAGFDAAASLGIDIGDHITPGAAERGGPAVCGILFRGERLFWWQVVGFFGTVSAWA